MMKKTIALLLSLALLAVWLWQESPVPRWILEIHLRPRKLTRAARMLLGTVGKTVPSLVDRHSPD